MVKSLTTKDFILRSQLIHKYRYNYSKVNYINSKTKVIIICENHGEFSQYPRHHYNYISIWEDDFKQNRFIS